MAFDDSDLDEGVRPGRTAKKPPAVPPPRKVPDERECPVKPLGKTSGLFALMTPGGEIEYIRAKDLAAKAVLAGLFDGDTRWLRDCFPDQKEFYNAHWAAAWLMQACVAQGFFQSERMVRGPGAWRLQRGKALLLHHGDEIEILSERGSPSVFDAGTRHGGYIYVASRPEAKPADEAATRDDVAGLFNLLDRWNYAHAQDPRVLLGWVGCAYLAGALKWRPHIWLTGETGTGKSTLEGVIRDLIGSSALRSAEPTKMAIAQALAGAARAVLLDEFERDIDLAKQESVVQLARLASTEDQAGIMRGSPEGRVRVYLVRACFYFSGIVPAPLKPQDRTRIHMIDLREVAPGRGDVAELMQLTGGMAALGPRLRRRAIDGFWRFQENERTFEAAILKVWNKGGRVVDQMGTLLAMSEMLLRDQAIGLDEACELLGAFEEVRDDILGRRDEGEADNCLSHLMSSTLTCGHAEKTVGEIVCDVRDESGDAGRLIKANGDHRVLMRHGLRVVRIGEGKELGLAVARKHRGLAQLFETTHWAGGAWNAVLKRVAGSYVPSQPVRFAGEIERCRVFPLPLLPIAFDAPGTDVREDCVEGPPQPEAP